MIMPCMKSTSACERAGSVPFVEGGSVLLGLPGAPGCTTTGCEAEAVCAARAGKPDALAEGLAIKSSAANSAAPPAAQRLRWRVRRISRCFRCGAWLNILNVLVPERRGKTPDTEKQLTLAKCPGIHAESGQANVTPEAAHVRAMNFNCCVFR